MPTPFKPVQVFNPTVAAAPKANPAVASGLSIGSGGQPLVNGAAPAPYTPPAPAFAPSPQASALLGPLAQPTPSGGTIVHPSAVAAFNNPAAAPTATNTSAGGLGQFVTNNVPTPNGGTLTTQANNGVPVGYNPNAGFSIDTNGAVPSSALTSTANPQQTHSQYQDYVNALSQAQGYSPAYLQAYQQQQQAQTGQAQLGLNAANISNQFYNGGPNIPGGATVDYLSGITAKAQSQNTLSQAENQIQQLSANQALNTQTLARTGNIASAQTQLQYSPTGMTGANAIQQYNTLQQQYPGANIPSYNPSLSPEQNQQLASQLVAQSGAYQAGFQSTFTTPGGGTGIYSKLNVQGLQQNPDGTVNLVSAAAAALGAAQAGVINTNLAGLSTINAAVESSSKTLASTKAFMQTNGINDYQSPIANQIQNAIKAKTAPAASLAAFQNDLTALRSDYSQYLVARGGSIAGSGPDSPEVLNAIPTNISYTGIEQIVGQMQAVGNNTATSLNNQIQQAMQGLQTNTVQSNSGGSTGGSIYDF